MNLRDKPKVVLLPPGHSDPCWVTEQKRGKLNLFAYGSVRTTEGQQTPAHRWSYMVHHGEIPKGYVVHHTCSTKGCINPDHLEAVTAGENSRIGGCRIRPEVEEWVGEFVARGTPEEPATDDSPLINVLRELRHAKDVIRELTAQTREIRLALAQERKAA